MSPFHSAEDQAPMCGCQNVDVIKSAVRLARVEYLVALVLSPTNPAILAAARSAESARAALATPAVHSDSSAAPVDLQITDHEKVAQLVFGRNRVVLDFHRIYPNSMPEEVLVNVELFGEADDSGHISLFEVVNIAAWR